jgi:outer membrane protein assembly factor BamA
VASAFSNVPYRTRFFPDHLAFGIGASSRFGVYGQAIASFSDLLGDHRVVVMGDVKGSISEYAHFYAAYLNLKHQVNYGGAVYYSSEYTPRRISPDLIYSDAYGGMRLLLRYPLSTSTRMDLETLAEKRFRSPAAYDSSNGYHRLSGYERMESFSFMPVLSCTYDDVLWSETGPLNGTRGQVRLNISPPLSFVSKPFVSFDSDIRRYWHIAHSLIWANRIAFGASFPLRGDSPARKFLLGGTENWFVFDYSSYNTRGYQANINDLPYSEVIVPFRGWGYFDLIGERFAVLNSEFRFQLIDNISFPFPLPFALRNINGALFCDAGNAWNATDSYKELPLPDKLLGGIGFGFRTNIGFFIIKYDRAWKTDWQNFVGPAIDYISIGSEF